MAAERVALVLAAAILATTATPALAQTSSAPTLEDELPNADTARLVSGIVALGAGVGLGILGTVALVERNSIVDDEGYVAFASGVPDGDVCGAARDGVPDLDYRVVPGAPFPSEIASRCDALDAWDITAVISIPSALLLAGIGAYLVASPDDSDPDMEIRANIAPGRYGVTLAGAF